MNQIAMNEFPRQEMFTERSIDDWIHRKRNDVLLWRFLLFRFSEFNCN